MATIIWHKRVPPCGARVGTDVMGRLGHRALRRNVPLTRPTERRPDRYGAFQPRFETDRRSASARGLASREESP